MWPLIFAGFVVPIQVCFAADVPGKLYTVQDVGDLVNVFAAYRDNEAIEKFADAVGDMSLLDKRRPDEGFDVVKLYLYGKEEGLFDSLRKTFLFCIKEGNEHFMAQLKKFLQSSHVNTWGLLYHALPYTSDFKPEEEGLLEMMKEVWKSENRQECELWQSAPQMEPFGTSWSRRGAWESKKYYLAMLKYELVSASPKIRKGLIKKAAQCLGLQDLVELESILTKQFGTEYSLGDISKIALGPSRISMIEEIGLVFAGLSNLFSEPQPGPFNNLPLEMWREIILHLDWRTLMYSMPYVNKQMYDYISHSRILFKCPDLQYTLSEQAQKCSPESLFVFGSPYSTIYPFFPKFLTHYMLHNDPKPWMERILEILQVTEIDYDMLLCKQSLFKGQHPSGISIDNLVYILHSIVASKPDDLEHIFMRLPKQLAVLLIGRMKGSKLNAEFFENLSHKIFAKFFFEAVLRADVLDWSKDFVEDMEGIINKTFNVQISLPFTADKIQSLSPEQLKSVITTFGDSRLIIKIFNALLEVDSEAKSILTVQNCKSILTFGLANFPTAMTPKQFGMLVKCAIELFGNDDEFQTLLSEFISKITESK